MKIRGKKYKLTERFWRNAACLLVLALAVFIFKQAGYELTLMGF